MTKRALREAIRALGADPFRVEVGRYVTAKGRTDYTARNRAMLEAGRHPATGVKTRADLGTCGGCRFHVVAGHRSRNYHKCERHRLGMFVFRSLRHSCVVACVRSLRAGACVVTLVHCSGPCGRTVEEHKARRELTLLARAGKGGTLSGVKRIRPTGRYFCDQCVQESERGAMDELFSGGAV